MTQPVTLNLNLENETDRQNLLSFYASLLATSAVYNNNVESNVINQLCNEIERNFKLIYTPAEWESMRALVTEQTQQAASIVTKSKIAFEGEMKIE